MPSATDIIGLAFGVVGLSSLFQALYSSLVSNLPRSKLTELDATMKETHELFISVLHEQLPLEHSFVTKTKSKLLSIDAGANKLREKVHIAATFRAQVVAMLDGLSRMISELSSEVVDVRTEIASTSSMARARSEIENQSHSICLEDVTEPSSPETSMSDSPSVPTSCGSLTSGAQPQRTPPSGEEALSVCVCDETDHATQFRAIICVPPPLVNGDQCGKLMAMESTLQPCELAELTATQAMHPLRSDSGCSYASSFTAFEISLDMKPKLEEGCLSSLSVGTVAEVSEQQEVVTHPYEDAENIPRFVTSRAIPPPSPPLPPIALPTTAAVQSPSVGVPRAISLHPNCPCDSFMCDNLPGPEARKRKSWFRHLFRVCNVQIDDIEKRSAM